MMGIFKRRKAAGPEAPAPEEEAVPQTEDYEAWSPDGAADAAPAEAQPGTYSPRPLVMETPQADAAELESIANAGGMGEQVVAALKKVYDPEIPVDIYEMGLVYGVDISEENDVSIRMTLTSPGCPVAEQMPGMVQHAVHTFVKGVRDVEVEIVWDPPWTPDRMSEAAQLELGFI
jgi:FeS assembly SUF system protein